MSEYTGVDVPVSIEATNALWNEEVEAGNTNGYIRADVNQNQVKQLMERDLWLKTYIETNTCTRSEVINMISALKTELDWKETVETYDDIATTYPSPEDGWTVNVKDTNITYRYDDEKTEWIAISANSIPDATSSVHGLMTPTDYAELWNISNTKIPSIWNSINQIENKTLPLGTMIPYVAGTYSAPAGFLFAEGQECNRSEYPDLCACLFGDSSTFNVVEDSVKDSYPGCFTNGDGYNTFRLPDMRGLFIRGWDNGSDRNYDSDRSQGSYQNDSLASHNHTIDITKIVSYDSDDENMSILYSNIESTEDTSTLNTNSTSGTETRPKNVSIRYIVKVTPTEVIDDDSMTSAINTTNYNAYTLNGKSTSISSVSDAIPVSKSNGKLDSSWFDLSDIADNTYIPLTDKSSSYESNKIPVSDVNGKLDGWITSATNSDIDTVLSEVFD